MECTGLCAGPVSISFEVYSSLDNSLKYSTSTGFDQSPSTDESTCVDGVKVEYELMPGEYMLLNMTLEQGDYHEGFVTYGLAGLNQSRYSFDKIEGPNCECVPDTKTIEPEWASWSGWSGCDCVSCGTIGRQTRSRSCSDPALETYGNNDFCSGPNQQFRECTMDTELCNIASPNQTDNNCGVIPGTTFSSCANQCSMTCMSLTSPESCNDDDSECEPGCVCPSGTVLDVVAEECVVPEACSCYDFVCDSYIENGAANASTCCPERQCSCVDGQLECEGNCPEDCAATEWSEWTMCDSQCRRSRNRCILTHGNYGGRECDGGEYQEELCDEDTATCDVCMYNGTQYRQATHHTAIYVLISGREATIRNERQFVTVD
ncbi:SCO-spondin-like [Symsagittifera roscoffensis]|uniref:SCO-spondin-like n=1 Tax=Symsagittifera roscoffensis TaxID=84072 RepID=UPI00307B4FF6